MMLAIMNIDFNMVMVFLVVVKLEFSIDLIPVILRIYKVLSPVSKDRWWNRDF